MGDETLGKGVTDLPTARTPAPLSLQQLSHKV
jgi:hypothetical protein